MSELSAPPRTPLHGDFRLDNIFFGTLPLEPVVSVVDWQLNGIGRGPYDVAYFLSQSLTPHDRNPHEKPMVRVCHETLEGGGVSGYSWDQCWEDYRRAPLFCLVYPLNTGAVNLANNRAVELMRTMLDRSVRASIDLDALDPIPV